MAALLLFRSAATRCAATAAPPAATTTGAGPSVVPAAGASSAAPSAAAPSSSSTTTTTTLTASWLAPSSQAAARAMQAVAEAAIGEAQTAGTYKRERVIGSRQSAAIRLAGGKGGEVLNFCANNYLGLADHPRLVAAAKRYLDTHGYGLSSVRFICGTQDIHKQLEQRIARFHGVDDCILYTSCWDANGGLFEVLLNDQDAVISDALNHASIIDGVRLCKAEKHRYRHMDLDDLEEKLRATQGRRQRLIVTDGVFSMDGDIAPLQRICDLADRYGALVMVDDSHATGFLGATGRGSIEYCQVMKRVHIVNSTLGKAMGGATGGYTAGSRELIDLLRQKSRPYLFSNSLAPPVVGAALEAFDMLDASAELRQRLEANTRKFRTEMSAAGFRIAGRDHPIAPVMLGDARLASQMADEMLAKGIYVIGFSFPVVPRGEARIRVQLSAAHTTEQVDRAIQAFVDVGRKLGVIGQAKL